MVDISGLCDRYGVVRLGLFGSAARDGFDETKSDIDFLVDFSPMKPAEHAESYFGLYEDLERLFSTPVDLVEWSSIRNPYFRESVEESHVVLYDAT
jgi:uncharacterized protein